MPIDLSKVDPKGLLKPPPAPSGLYTYDEPMPWDELDIIGTPPTPRRIYPDILTGWFKPIADSPSGPTFVGATKDGGMSTCANGSTAASIINELITVDQAAHWTAPPSTKAPVSKIYALIAQLSFKAAVSERIQLLLGLFCPATSVNYQLGTVALWTKSDGNSFIADYYAELLYPVAVDVSPFFSPTDLVGPSCYNQSNIPGIQVAMTLIYE